MASRNHLHQHQASHRQRSDPSPWTPNDDYNSIPMRGGVALPVHSFPLWFVVHLLVAPRRSPFLDILRSQLLVLRLRWDSIAAVSRDRLCSRPSSSQSPHFHLSLLFIQQHNHNNTYSQPSTSVHIKACLYHTFRFRLMIHNAQQRFHSKIFSYFFSKY